MKPVWYPISQPPRQKLEIVEIDEHNKFNGRGILEIDSHSIGFLNEEELFSEGTVRWCYLQDLIDCSI